MSPEEARQQAAASPWFRLCLTAAVLLILAAGGLALYRPEVPAKGEPRLLEEADGISCGPYALEPGHYLVVLDPGSVDRGLCTVFIPRVGEGVGFRHDFILDGRHTHWITVDQAGDYAVELRLPRYGGGPKSIRVTVHRQLLPPWILLAAGGLLLWLAHRLFAVHLRVLRGESF